MTDGAQPDSGYQAYNTRSSDMDKLGQLLQQFVGDPRLASVIKTAMEQGLGSALTSYYGVPGSQAGQVGFGSSNLFGPQNVGYNMMNTLNQQGINAVMGDSVSVTERIRKEQLQNFLVYTGQKREDVAALAQAPFTFTGALHNMVFNSMQPRELQAGMEEGIRYMGVGGMAGFRADDKAFAQQNLLRHQMQGVTSGLLSNYLQNNESFYGLKGQDVGRVFAELSRGGGFRDALATSNASLQRQFGDRLGTAMDAFSKDPNSGEGLLVKKEIDQLTARTTAITREASQTIQAFRQVFKGSVTDVLDQINGMMGTDVIQTFRGAEGRHMALQLGATGWATGFAPQQMAQMGAAANFMAKQAGIDPWGAASVATLSAQMMGALRDPNLGGNMAGVNEERFRNSMIARTLGAQESGLARDIAGAYAMFENQADVNVANKFRESLQATPVRNTADLVARAQQFIANTPGLNIDASGFNEYAVRNASYSLEGERSRALGVGGLEALRSNADVISGSRAAMLRLELESRGMNETEATAVIKRIKGPVTIQSIKEALRADSKDTKAVAMDTLAFQGSLSQRFGQQAQALGLGGNAQESDNMMLAMSSQSRTKEALDRVQKMAAGNVAFQDLFADRGIGSGLTNLNTFLSHYKDRDMKTATKDFVEIMTGRSTISAAEVEKFADINTGLTAEIKTRMSSQDPAERGRAMRYETGLAAAVQGQLTGQVNGKALSNEQHKMISTALSDPTLLQDKRLEMLSTLAGTLYGDQIFAAETGALAANVLTKHKGKFKDGLSAEQQQVVENSVSLSQVAALQPGALASAESKAMGNDKFLDMAKEYSSYYRSRVESGTLDAAGIEADFLKGKSAKDKEEFTAFKTRWQNEAIANKNVGGGPDSSPMGQAVWYLQKIFEWLGNQTAAGLPKTSKARGPGG